MVILAIPSRVVSYETHDGDPATLLTSFGERGAWFAAHVTAIAMGSEPLSDPVVNESVFITFTLNDGETYYAAQWYTGHDRGVAIPRTSAVTYYGDPEMIYDIDADELEFLAHDGGIVPISNLDDLVTALADAVRS